MTNLHRSVPIAGLLTAAAMFACPVAHAANVYIALGDSITFGETDLVYQGSYGDRGYVGNYADSLAASLGSRPQVINLAIDGETASSFMSGVGRTPPVAGRTDVPLALENLHYNAANLVSQSTLFASTVAAQRALGNSIADVTITLGFNEVAALSSLPTADALALIPQTLAAYRTNYNSVLTEVRSFLPTTHLTLVGYYNPFPANPTSPAAPIFNAAGMQLNGLIAGLASQYGASFADTASAFLGHESAYTYLDESPAGSSVEGVHGGVLPIGNVHPNTTGYAAIATQVEAVSAVPEPSTWLTLLAGLATVSIFLRRGAGSRAAPGRRVPA